MRNTCLGIDRRRLQLRWRWITPFAFFVLNSEELLTIFGEVDFTTVGGQGGCDCLLRSKSVSIRCPL